MIGEAEIERGAAMMEAASPDGDAMAEALGVDKEALHDFSLSVVPPMAAHAGAQITADPALFMVSLVVAMSAAYSTGFLTGVAAERSAQVPR